MKKLLSYVMLFLIVCCFFLLIPEKQNIFFTNLPIESKTTEIEPYEYYFMAKNYPDYNEFERPFNEAMEIATQMFRSRSSSGFSLNWQLEGPRNIGGRINTVEIDPTDSNIIYIGLSDGGIFKTADGGNNWFPIFDNAGKLAMGDIAIDPSDHNTIYAATGDPNISGYPAVGDGLYKSTDAGITWTNIGLADKFIISHIIIDPSNSNIIYAATMGFPFQRDLNRGLYKTIDGGATWNNILFTSDSSGVIDLEMDPTDNQTLYAATWNRIRNNQETLLTGADAKIWKTTNGGTSWTNLTNGLPAPKHCRISIEISKQNHNKLYASYVDANTLDLHGIFRTTNGGTLWDSLSISGLPSGVMGGFGWYNDAIKIDPYHDNNLYFLAVDLYRSTNSGVSWNMVSPPWWTYDVHADKHDLKFISNNTFLVCTDGGLYRTRDNGSNYYDIDLIPNTEFYRVTVNPFEDSLYAGGAQDNGTSWGNINNTDIWPRIYGGDGFTVVFDDADPNIVYAETQNGGIVVSTDGGSSFVDATTGISGADRTNWDQHYILSKFDHSVMYTGTYKVYKAAGAPNPVWAVSSPDLTDGVIFGDRFHNISCVAENSINPMKIYAGTSDGNVWRSLDAAGTWTNISAGLPDRYVTRIVPSKVNENTLYVTNSGYRDGELIPHIHMSTDNGSTWNDISGDLPPIGVNDVELTGLNDSLIFAATDAGVYYTINQGTNWERLGNNMPFIWVFDIELDLANKKLIAGTFARSMQSIRVDSILASFSTVNALASADDTICNGESTILSASGGLYYNWTPSLGLSCANCASTSASPATTTRYIVEASNGVISDFDTVTIYVNPVPLASAITSSNDTIFSNSPGFAYQWYRNGTLLSGENNVFIKTSIAGSYQVVLTNSFGCSSTSSLFAYDGWNALPYDLRNIISLYPNPSPDCFYIKWRDGILPTDFLLKVYDANGHLIRTCNLKNERMINMSNLANGNYLIEVSYGKMKMHTQWQKQ